MELTVNLGENSYPIYIENGILPHAGEYISKFYQGKKIILISDDNVFPLYGETVLNSLQNYECHTLVLPHGEPTKSFESLPKIYSAMLDAKISRSDLVIALGGGVIGDLAGFAASSFLRGVKLVQIPTSLLAQVDSSVGGKVAVDLPQGKNLVGAFFHPKMVLIDPDVLNTLPTRYINDGMGEVIKYGCIKDADAVFTDNTSLSGDLMRACPNLKFIGKLATGYDNIDLETASQLGIAVYNTPGYSTEAVAQHTIALLLEAACRIRAKNTLAKQGLWVADGVFSYDDAPSMLLAGRSLGIIGYGNIGRKVGEIASALGMKINIYSCNRETAVSSDVITLHCPATADNYHMINKEFISQMKDGAVIVNTARGSLIDEAALANALKSGKISYAALDVLEQEPPVRDNPLLYLENCCITPHAAWIPPETRQKVIDIAAKNISDYINGKDTNRII